MSDAMNAAVTFNNPPLSIFPTPALPPSGNSGQTSGTSPSLPNFSCASMTFPVSCSAIYRVTSSSFMIHSFYNGRIPYHSAPTGNYTPEPGFTGYAAVRDSYSIVILFGTTKIVNFCHTAKPTVYFFRPCTFLMESHTNCDSFRGWCRSMMAQVSSSKLMLALRALFRR